MHGLDLVNMARELLSIEQQIRYHFENSETHISDFHMIDFDQTWGSTSLGFSGIGGQVITTARTYVFIPIIANEKCQVYFAGKYAYSVPYSKVFIEDVRNCNVESVSGAGKYCVKE